MCYDRLMNEGVWDMEACLLGKLSMKREMGRPGLGWEDNIEINLEQIYFECVKYLAGSQYDPLVEFCVPQWMFVISQGGP